MKIQLAFPLVLMILFSACKTPEIVENPYSHIPDQKVVESLKKSFATLGGLENWQNKKELHYEKQTKSYLKSGELDWESYQFHDYFYHKNPSININWESEDGKKHKISSKNGNAEKYIDDQLDKSAKTETLNNSVTTSLFVIGVPFKMIDKGVVLSHEGMDSLEDGQEVVVIKAIYNPSDHAHHTTSDVWWYYFDPADYKMVAYLIKHADHYSYIKNLEYTTVNGFVFPQKRISYKVDAERNILNTAAEYAYTNWKIK